jgi:methionyl-tRNA formyltransferase
MRIIFMGTPELACASLQALLASADFQVVAVVTQPDRPKGRDLKLQPSSVKEIALRAKLPVLQPERARNQEFIAGLRKAGSDLIAVVAYGQILPKSILDLPRLGCLNVHTSLLPKYRGAAPIQWAILNDEPETGVTIMKMDVGMDTGDILAQETTPIDAEDTAQTLHDRLAKMGAELLLRTIPAYTAGKIQSRPQPAEGATYAPKIKKEDGQIDWGQPARAIWNRVRGLVPWPGAFTRLSSTSSATEDLSRRSGAKADLLKIWQAEPVDLSGPPGEILRADKAGLVIGCGVGALRILALQREGGRRLIAGEFLAGHPLKPGQRLGASN